MKKDFGLFSWAAVWLLAIIFMTAATGSAATLSPTSSLIVARESVISPGTLTAVINANKNVELSWQDNSAGKASFRIERKSTGIYAEIKKLPPGTVNYVDLTAEQGIAYTYRLRACVVDTAGVEHFSAYTNEATATIPLIARQITIKPELTAPTVQIQQLADLTVDSVKANGIIKDGDKAGATTFSAVIKNAGAGAAAASKVKFSIAALSGGPVPAELVSAVKDSPILSAGQTITISWPSLTASVWKTGQYRLTVEADTDKTVAESNDANNVKTLDFTVVAQTVSMPVKIFEGGTTPVAGATVTASSAAGSETKSTDTSGIATFSLPYGNCSITATKAGYENRSTSYTIDQYVTMLSLEISKLAAVKVTVAEGQTPLSGATVSTTVNSRSITQTTDTAGTTTFANLRAGEVLTFTASKTGYTTSQSVVTVPKDGSTLALPINLIFTNPLGNLKIDLIDNDTAAPLSGATVLVSGQSQTTGSTGSVTFTGLPVGTVYPSVQLTGYQASQSSVSAQITRDSTTTLTYKMFKPVYLSKVEIVVTDNSTFTLLSGATVAIKGLGVAKSLVTDPSGKVLFSGLPYGDYTYSVKKDGYMPTQEIGFKLDNTTGLSISSKITKLTTTIFTILDYSKQPLGGAQIVLTGNGQSQTQTTDSLGSATFSNLYPANYTAAVSKDGYVSTQYQYSPITEITKPTLSLDKYGSAKVTVKDNTGNFVSGATISVMIGSATQTVTTDAQGTANFTDMSTGRYTFTVSKTGYGTNQTIADMSNGAALSVAVQLTLIPGSADILVVDSSSKALANAAVTLTGNGQNNTVNTSSTGGAHFTGLTPGSYQISVTLAGYETGSGAVNVTGAQSVSAIINLIKHAGNAALTVTDSATTKSLVGATVKVTANGQALSASTNAQGVATFNDLLPGTYTFSIEMASYNTGSAAATIAVNSTTALQVALDRILGSYYCLVSDKNTGAKIDGVSITLTGNGKNLTQTTDSQGETTFSGLPIGTYSIAVNKAGYTALNYSDTIVNGGVKQVPIGLNKLGGMAVTVVDDQGSPVPGAEVTVKVNNTPVTNYTDSQGVATVSNLPEARYTVSVYKAGYIWSMAYYTKTAVSTIDVVVSYGATSTQTVELMKTTGNIAVTVTEASTGAPVNGALVEIVAYSGGLPPSLSAQTNSQGVANFTNLPNGTYTLQISQSGLLTRVYATVKGNTAAVNATLLR